MRPARWAIEEIEVINTCIQSFEKPKLTDVVAKVFEALQEFHGKTVRTMPGVSEKIRHLGVNQRTTPEGLLKDWPHHYPSIRNQVSGSRPYRKRNRRGKLPANRPGQQDASELTIVEEARLPTSPYLERTPTPTADDVHLLDTSFRSESPFRSSTGPTSSPITSWNSQNAPDKPDTCQTSEVELQPLDLYPWERTLIGSLRGFLSDKGYDQPPTHDWIKTSLQRIGEELDDGIKAFRSAFSVVRISSLYLTEDALELARLLFKPKTDDSRPLTSSHISSRLRTLYGDLRVTTNSILKLLAAVAVFAWVLQEFDDDPHGKMANNFHETLNLFERQNPILLEKLRVAAKMDYLANTVVPSLPTSAESLQSRLTEALLSMRVPVGELSARSRAFFGETRDFDMRHQKLLECEEKLNGAFLNALNLRVALARSKLIYKFYFPRQGDVYEAECMEQLDPPVHVIDGRSKICLCLRPAIYSSGRSETSLPWVLVIPALVMVEDIGPSPPVGKRHVSTDGRKTNPSCESPPPPKTECVKQDALPLPIK